MSVVSSFENKNQVRGESRKESCEGSEAVELFLRRLQESNDIYSSRGSHKIEKVLGEERVPGNLSGYKNGTAISQGSRGSGSLRKKARRIELEAKHDALVVTWANIPVAKILTEISLKLEKQAAFAGEAKRNAEKGSKTSRISRSESGVPVENREGNEIEEKAMRPFGGCTEGLANWLGLRKQVGAQDTNIRVKRSLPSNP